MAFFQNQGQSRIDPRSPPSYFKGFPDGKKLPENDSYVDKMVPVLPLRDVVVYPHMVIPLFVGRDKSIQALESAMRENKQIMLVAQKDVTELIQAKKFVGDPTSISHPFSSLRLSTNPENYHFHVN